MTGQNNHPASGFWFGFALGTLATGASFLLLGTKKGRKTLTRVLELTEDFEENAFMILEELQEKAEEYGPEIKDAILNNIPNKTSGSGIAGLLNRISLLSPSHNKHAKKYMKSSS